MTALSAASTLFLGTKASVNTLTIGSRIPRTPYELPSVDNHCYWQFVVQLPHLTCESANGRPSLQSDSFNQEWLVSSYPQPFAPLVAGCVCAYSYRQTLVSSSHSTRLSSCCNKFCCYGCWLRALLCRSMSAEKLTFFIVHFSSPFSILNRQ